MAKAKPKLLVLFLLLVMTFNFEAYTIQDHSGRPVAQVAHREKHTKFSPAQRELLINQDNNKEVILIMKKNPRRLMIGSTAPTCTYNECKGCKYKCRAEQVPVEGNDPINSAYHYRCVCHR